jgi:phosphoglycolate phosphatase
MTLAKPTIVIFDMDGTAVRHINPRLLHILEFLDNLSYKTTKLFKWAFHRGGRGRIVPVWHEKRKQPRLLVHRAIHKFRRKPVEQIVEPCPGLFQLLELLEQKHIPLALVSNGLGSGYGHEILQKFGLDRYFKITVFREDIQNSKPHPEPILTALSMISPETKKEEIVWYIGDRRKDVIAAQAAAAHTVCQIVPIAFGFHAATAILERNIGQDHIFMSFHDMYDQLIPMFENDSGTPSKEVSTSEKTAGEKTPGTARAPSI